MILIEKQQTTVLIQPQQCSCVCVCLVHSSQTLKDTCDALGFRFFHPFYCLLDENHKVKQWQSTLSQQAIYIIHIYSTDSTEWGLKRCKPSCWYKPVWISLFYWTQKKILWRMLVTKQLLEAIDFHTIIFFLHTMEVNGYQQLFGYQHFF